jgi:hypothetical protein
MIKGSLDGWLTSVFRAGFTLFTHWLHLCGLDGCTSRQKGTETPVITMTPCLSEIKKRNGTLLALSF